jgi:hypothetical protein
VLEFSQLFDHFLKCIFLHFFHIFRVHQKSKEKSKEQTPGKMGVEPITDGFGDRCSTIELLPNKKRKTRGQKDKRTKGQRLKTKKKIKRNGEDGTRTRGI